MANKVIFPEDLIDKGSQPFHRLMKLVPLEERLDIKLKRFLLFRMKIDGEEATRDYLLKGIAHAREHDFKGSLFDFLMESGESLAGGFQENSLPDEPG